MSKVIAIAGKGGVGKTTFSGLLVRHLLRTGNTPVFAVDADANVNLNDVLGVEVDKTIGTVREETAKAIGGNAMPVGMPKETFLEMQMEEALVESEGFDLLVMGRPEGAGCYCFANNLLRKHVDALSKNYPYIVIDNEAGLEHMSRRTTQGVDQLFIVSDASPVGIKTAARIKKLSEEMDLDIKSAGLVLSRVQGDLHPALLQMIEENDLNLMGQIPASDEVLDLAYAGRPVLDLPDDSSVSQAVAAVVENSGI